MPWESKRSVPRASASDNMSSVSGTGFAPRWGYPPWALWPTTCTARA
ncbi:MAG: hypothetical protein L3J86_06245 [Thermoplasmata archaeon]|nr:hypothetical protein [Thermoplasmata archaeon]